MPQTSPRPWFPFSATEVEIALGVFAFVESCLFFLGVQGRPLAWFALVYVTLVYMCGLLVHRRGGAFEFVRDGALQGTGYIRYFRGARKSLLLVHADADPPGEELLGLYKGLLERGVEVRRIIFVRSDQDPESYEWIERFGAHERLMQRVVPPSQAALIRSSFVVVDERCVIVAVPGSSPLDGESYARKFVLRDLLVIEDPDAAEAFTQVHGQLWARATPLVESALGGGPKDAAST
tara:strand:- start:386 stop:1093 length:708 start_codon:yes stop_codon:yes gene_type:complete